MCEGVKLSHISENLYADFIRHLQRFDGVCYSVATNAALNTPEVLNVHQKEQVQKILRPIGQMLHESGREAIRELARKVDGLPHQLYVQMICQVQLVLQIL